jgi:hypothetical protein
VTFTGVHFTARTLEIQGQLTEIQTNFEVHTRWGALPEVHSGVKITIRGKQIEIPKTVAKGFQMHDLSGSPFSVKILIREVNWQRYEEIFEVGTRMGEPSGSPFWNQNPDSRSTYRIPYKLYPACMYCEHRVINYR